MWKSLLFAGFFAVLYFVLEGGIFLEQCGGRGRPMYYQYTLRGGAEEFRPYWYLGFRYIEVENAPADFDGSAIRMIVRHNRVDPDASSFECSNPTLNATWDLVKRSLMLGSHEQFVDTPTREQGQFTYDAYQISIGAMRSTRRTYWHPSRRDSGTSSRMLT